MWTDFELKSIELYILRPLTKIVFSNTVNRVNGTTNYNILAQRELVWVLRLKTWLNSKNINIKNSKLCRYIYRLYRAFKK